VLPALRDGSLDLALTVRMCSHAELPTDCRADLQYLNDAVIIARHDHPLGGAQRLGALAGAEWVRTGTPDNTSALPEAFRAAGLPPPRYPVDCASFLAVPELVARSDLLAVVPWQNAAREERAGRIRRVAVREVMPAREISLFRRADVPPTPIARECAEILRVLARRPA
jgi:DNA-binding transcriptional LysR family regulator